MQNNNNYIFLHYLTKVFSVLGQIGLDWREIKATLNPTFEWKKAVQVALDTDDSLESVWIYSPNTFR